MDWYDKSKSKSRILYHIGQSPPHPVPYYPKGPYEVRERKRWWRDPRDKDPVVFLTPRFEQVWNNHGISGNVYAYEVPEWVIEESGGIHSFDYAPEVVIPERLWRYVKFLGKKYDKQKAREIVKEKIRPFPKSFFGKEDTGYKEFKVGDLVAWVASPTKGSLFRPYYKIMSIYQDTMTVKYIGPEIDEPGSKKRGELFVANIKDIYNPSPDVDEKKRFF